MRRVPTAGCDPTEDALASCHVIEVERLGVELGSEAPHITESHGVSRACEGVADSEVIEVQGFLFHVLA